MMDKNKKMILAASALTAVFVISIFSLQKEQRGANVPLPSPEETVSPQRARTLFSNWGRNPFMLSGELSEGVRGLMLDGIVWDEQKPFAVINDQVLGVGDTIGTSRITQITKTEVFLEENGNAFTLRLTVEK